jgi:MoxR-like ATPase
MPTPSQITDQELESVRQAIAKANGNAKVRAWMIAAELAKRTPPVVLDVSTLRGRFIDMGKPLSGGIGSLSKSAQEKGEGTLGPQPTVERSKPLENTKREFIVDEAMKKYIPQGVDFDNYIERPVDQRLAVHYMAGKYPLTQGKQGTGKTYSHAYFAYKHQLPFFLFSCYEDFRLQKLFGDKTIINGNIVFQESIFVQAIQSACVILADEINAVSNPNTYDWHALLQQRELFIKDADNGKGKVYKLHPDCMIGFAQNPKSAKYIGGNVKGSNFLGRCTFITYPEFTKAQIHKAITLKFPNLVRTDVDKFSQFYFACNEAINRADIPVDISIRQLNNVIDLYNHGLTLSDAVEDGLTSILEAVSQHKNKEAFTTLAKGVWKEMLHKGIHDQVGEIKK